MMAAIDLGTLESLDAFYQHLGLDGGDVASWQPIEEPETHDWDALAAEDAARAAAGAGAGTSLAARDDDPNNGNMCAHLPDWRYVVCATVPSRVPWWTAGGALAIWYTPDLMDKFTRSVATIIITASAAAAAAAAATSPPSPRQFRLSVPVFGANGNSSSAALDARDENPDNAEMAVHNDYIFEEAAGIVHYMGTRATLTAEERAPSAQRGTVRARQTRNYTISLQATALSLATTSASESCVAEVVKNHINRASEHDRFRCAPVDNRGSWLIALHVNIDWGRGNDQEHSQCCDV
ncbi:hypothetical protein PG994_002290 [Apiospora phragmitis]|uniref:Uncharacterized protein n=1 Tax=Apiospora phragmitis TaxID=2905665 RepID=A0ABR1WVZ3_9PEZI